jgi:hypothetical protein
VADRDPADLGVAARPGQAAAQDPPRSSGPGSDPLGTSASATRNTMATTSAQAPARMRNHSGVTAPPVAGTAPARARVMGPATANPISPASSSRSSPNRSPSSRRASMANPPTIATTLTRISTAVRAMASSLIALVLPGRAAG